MSTLNEWLSTEERRMDFAEEELIVEAAEEIWAAMDDARVTKKDIAERLGKSKAFISQLLNGSRNMTLRSLANIAYCVGYRAKISLERQETVANWKPMENVQLNVRYLETLRPIAPQFDKDVAKGAWTKLEIAA